MEHREHDSTIEPNIGVLSDEAAESEFLGWMLLVPDLSAVATVPPDIFSTQQNRDLAEVMIGFAERGIVFDPFAIQQEFRRRGKEISIATLTELTFGVSAKRPAEYRIRYLRELRDRQRAAKVAEQLGKDLCDLTLDLQTVLATAVSQLEAAS